MAQESMMMMVKSLLLRIRWLQLMAMECVHLLSLHVSLCQV
jgi:hypothetical protein